MYVIVRESDGKYVAKPGSERSYTPRLRQARKFSTKEEAEKERCVDNETIASVMDEVGW